MKPTILFLTVAFLMVFSAHRLPAPIAEEEQPTATPAKAKPARAKSSISADGAKQKVTRGFDGSWVGTASGTGTGFSYNAKFTMLIKSGEMADSIEELTTTLAPDQKIWGGIPEPYNGNRTLYRKWKWSSTDLTVDGSNLRVRWNAPQLVDWSPKAIPSAVIQPASVAKAKISIYTLKGDQLTRDFDSQGGVIFHRVR